MARVLIDTNTALTGDVDYNGDIVEFRAKVSGPFAIRNAIIEANPYLEIFNTEVSLVNCKTREFSTAWFGAKSTNVDNSIQLQKAIDTCIANSIRNLFVAASYNFGTSLKIQNLSGSTYLAATLNIYGDSGMWDGHTTLTYTSNTGFAVGFQLAKGGSIHHLQIKGNYIPPAHVDASYYTTAFPVRAGYNGLVIDWDGSHNTSGSTALSVYDIMVDGFDVLYAVSPNGVTFNADVLSFTNIRCGHGRIGFQSGQAQEKGNQINNIVSWGNLHTLISIGHSSKYQAGQYIIRNGNIAGNCVQLFDVSLSGWNGFAVHGLFAEGIARIGTIYAFTTATLLPVDLQNLYIRFALKASAGSQTLLTSNSVRIKITNSILWYYGTIGETMSFVGPMTFENCDFGRSTWSNSNALHIKYVGGALTTIHTQ